MIESITPAFLASEFPPAAPEKALFHIIPAPLERSVSYGSGCALGPAAILEASQQLEAWDGSSLPGELGIFTAPAVDCRGTMEQSIAAIADSARTVLRHKALPVLLGGEHSATLGVLQALAEKHGSFGLVHIDAHADLRPSYQGSIFSHASIMHRAVADLGLRLAQFGVRDLCLEEVQIRKQFGVHFCDAPQLVPALMRQELPAQLLPQDFPERVYLSFDVDGLDPSLVPATGTPVPGGLDWYGALAIVRACLTNRTVLGFDLVELAPLPGLHSSNYTSARLVYHIMGIIARHTRLPERDARF